ncbi:MAG: hypothetical protein IPJ46_21610 [Anaerolineales bacterium]|nr:hypothetical protein [Anaerolineales bacterium]
MDWKDRNTCILFGDGAGAFVLQASDKPGGGLSAVMDSDGSGADSLTLLGGSCVTSSLPQELTACEGKHFVQMDGRRYSAFATRVKGRAVMEALEALGLTTNDVQWIIPHQANFPNY